MAKSIKMLFVVSVVVISVILLGILTFVNVHQLTTNMEAELESMLTAKSGEISESFDKRLTQVSGKTASLALAISSMNNYDMNYAADYVTHIVQSDDAIYGSGLWFAKDAYPGAEWYGPYWSKGNDGKVSVTMDYSNAEYNYPQVGWYKAAIKGPKDVFWDEPAYDDVSKTSMLTSSAPIRHNGQIVGVVTVDIGMKDLEEYIENIKIGDNGYAFLLSGSGKFVAYKKDPSKNLKEDIRQSQDAKLAAIGKTLMESDSQLLVKTDAFGTDSYVMSSPIGHSGMRLVLVAPTADYMGPIRSAIMVSIVMSLIVIILLCAALLYIFNSRIGTPITHLIEKARDIAGGNLNTEIVIEHDDEIGELAMNMKKMADEIQKIIGNINSMSQQLSAASEELFATADQSTNSLGQIAQSATDVAGGAKEQESHINGVANSMDNVAGTVESVNSLVRSTLQRTDESIKAMSENSAAMKSTTEQMKRINDSITTAQEAIVKLGEQSNKIGEIVGTIAGISDQTNLLALNAAIEAARAGEQGRGFAVVAEEVRKLAEQSQSAAADVAELIGASTSYTDTAVKEMATSTDEVTRGTESMQHTAELFGVLSQHIKEVSEAVKDVSVKVNQISNENHDVISATEQLKDIGVKTTTEVNNISQQINDQQQSQKDITSASQSLADLAQELQRIIGHFTV